MIAKKYQVMIAGVSDETGNEDGYWIDLKNGYWLPLTETHSIHEDTKREAEAMLKDVRVCDGPCCQKGGAK